MSRQTRPPISKNARWVALHRRATRPKVHAKMKNADRRSSFFVVHKCRAAFGRRLGPYILVTRANDGAADTIIAIKAMLRRVQTFETFMVSFLSWLAWWALDYPRAVDRGNVRKNKPCLVRPKWLGPLPVSKRSFETQNRGA
jgi:hypothetical protein